MGELIIPEQMEEPEEIPGFLKAIGAGPKLDGLTPQQRLPPYVFKEGTPELDDAFYAAYGPPKNDNEVKARQYIRDNPAIWEAVVERAQVFMVNGQRFSFRTIGENIRWEDVPGLDRSKPFKLSNNYTPYFSRYFRHIFPEVKNYITFHDDD